MIQNKQNQTLPGNYTQKIAKCKEKMCRSTIKIAGEEAGCHGYFLANGHGYFLANGHGYFLSGKVCDLLLIEYARHAQL
jgi:hypothetical protein